MRIDKSFSTKLVIAALVLLSAAVSTFAQDSPPLKQNRREQPDAGPVVKVVHSNPAEAGTYSYEFNQPEFYIRHILIEHDGDGRGHLTFEKHDGGEPITEPLELSEAARSRILSLWGALGFLDSEANYQSERQYPHLGTMHLRMKRGSRERVAEFNWTNDKTVTALVDEYRHAANQTIFVFNITLSRQNQPLEAPKLMDELERMVTRNELSDRTQLVPLLQDLTTDERIPLMARNHAARILKKIQK